MRCRPLLCWAVISTALLAVPGFAQLKFTKHTIDSKLRGAYWVYARDVDLDGKTDVLAASSSGPLNWYRNDGKGNFSKTKVGDFKGAWGVFAEDVDSDGDIDILGASSRLNEIAWWENQGNRNFVKHVVANQYRSAEAVSAADLDEDGDTDIVGTAWGDDEIAWFENNGNQQFTKRTLDRNFKGAHGTFVADLDQDGDLDIVGSSALKVAWWRNDGKGGFSRKIVNSSEGALGVFVADVDRDGHLDVLATSRKSENVDWFKNNGSGGFSRKTVASAFGNAWSVAAADVDGDGDTDVASGGIFNNSVKLWENDGQEHFTEHILDDRFEGVRSVYMADLDGDRDNDVIAVARKSNEVAWWEVSGVVSVRTITLISPNGDEQWLTGSHQEITWRSQGSIAQVELEYSGDGGNTWTTIVAATENDGSYAWTVPDIPSAASRVRISDASDGSVADVSDNDFSVTNPFITVLQPNGGETWPLGSSQIISWSSVGAIDSVKIEFSSDAGQSWTTLASAFPNNGSYAWTLPNLESDRCLIRISSVANGGVFDVSDAVFSVSFAGAYAQRVNAGGASYTSGGKTWSADQPYAVGAWGYDGGRAFARKQSINNTDDDPLYQSERFGMAAYRFTVSTSGRYQVVLHFAEMFYHEAGKRVFDVLIENQLLLDDLDVFAVAGRNAPLVRAFEVDVNDGVLDITFEQKVDNPKISAIEVRSVSRDTTAPAISNLALSSLSESSATISWETDEAADTQVEYGVDATYGQTTSLLTALAISHSQTLTGLTPNTLYHFRVRSRDGSGNLGLSADSTFTTASPDETPPLISNVVLSDTSTNNVTVAWSTDEAADSQVEFGLDTSYTNLTVLDSALVTAHAQILSGLSANTVYHYRVKSRDSAGNLATSADFTFRTIAEDTTPPLLSDLAVQEITSGGATVTWTTDEPSNSQVLFGVDSTYGQASPLDTSLVKAHTVLLTGLLSNTTYHFQARSADARGNLGSGADSTFTTAKASDYAQRVNAGGASYASGGKTWSADQPYAVGAWGYDGGQAFSRNHNIEDSDDDPLYQSERFGMSAYRFTVPANGRYQVVLHFAEIFYHEAGKRIFDVLIEDQLLLDDLDLFAAAGRNTPVVRTFEVDVNDGVLDITFEQKVDNPKISAIEVRSASRDTTAPAISNLALSSLSANSATISWETDEAADTQVEYGVDTTYGQATSLLTALAISHSQTLTGLTPNTLYHFRVRSRDGSGNLGLSADSTFTTAAAAAYAQRVNAGGASYTSGGKTWAADQPYAVGAWGYDGGRAFTRKQGITDTDDDPLYQSERYGMAAYRFTVPANGRYQVVLHFAEMFYHEAGKRVFDVLIEDQLLLDDLDVFAVAGRNAPLVRTFEVDVNDGVLDITFEKNVDKPKISAIEIEAAQNLTPKILSLTPSEGLPGTQVVVTGQNFMTNPDLTLTRDLKIMPLGDSITKGVRVATDSAGYRNDLAKLLTEAGVRFDFVGSQSHGHGFDSDHEGHGGWRADQIRSRIRSYLRQNKPDVVLLHIGTNNISQLQTAATVKEDVGKLIDAISAFDARIKIILSSLIPRTDGLNDETARLNQLLLSLLEEKYNAGYPIYYAGNSEAFLANPAWQSKLMGDDVHPNDRGYAVMAGVWFDALLNVISSSDLTVEFNGVVAHNYTIQSSTRILVTVPEGATTGKIEISTSAGSAVSASDFTVLHGLTARVSDADQPIGEVETATDLAYANQIPDSFTLYPNFPNPFNLATEIRFDLPEAADVRLEIFNIRGERVRTLIEENQSAGQHFIRWDGKTDRGLPVASGVYVYRIAAGHWQDSKLMTLLK